RFLGYRSVKRDIKGQANGLEFDRGNLGGEGRGRELAHGRNLSTRVLAGSGWPVKQRLPARKRNLCRVKWEKVRGAFACHIIAVPEVRHPTNRQVMVESVHTRGLQQEKVETENGISVQARFFRAAADALERRVGCVQYREIGRCPLTPPVEQRMERYGLEDLKLI